MSRFEPLLEVQDLDLAIAQVQHKLERLPERAAVEANAAALAALEAQIATVERRRHDIARDQARLEDHVSTLDTKIAEIEGRLYGSAMTSPKEALTLQEEQQSLARRRSGFEDELLELMELAEPLDGELAALADQRRALDEEAARLLASLAEAEAVLTGEREALETRRTEAAARAGEELIALYEPLRRRHAGIGVARLSGTSCLGCHLTLSAVAVDRIRKLPEDEVAHCEECGRLLVR